MCGAIRGHTVGIAYTAGSRTQHTRSPRPVLSVTTPLGSLARGTACSETARTVEAQQASTETRGGGIPRVSVEVAALSSLYLRESNLFKPSNLASRVGPEGRGVLRAGAARRYANPFPLLACTCHAGNAVEGYMPIARRRDAFASKKPKMTVPCRLVLRSLMAATRFDPEPIPVHTPSRRAVGSS